MIAWSPSLLIALLSAPGDVHRCATADGTVHYQELPCQTDQPTALPAGDASDQKKLRQWLQELQRQQPGSRQPRRQTDPAAVSRLPSLSQARAGRLPLPSRPRSQASLASCSALFLDCADSSDARMDQCVDTITLCSEHSGTCCEDAFIERYQLLRADGASRKTAVRDALLRD